MFGYIPEDFLKKAIERTETTTVGDDRKNVENHWFLSAVGKFERIVDSV